MISHKIGGSRSARPYVLGSQTPIGQNPSNYCLQVRGPDVKLTAGPYSYSRENQAQADPNGWGLAACAWNKGASVLTLQTAQMVDASTPTPAPKASFGFCWISNDKGKTFAQVTVPNFGTGSEVIWYGYSVAAKPDGSVIVAVGQSAAGTAAVGHSRVMCSLDQGATWTSATIPSGAFIAPGVGSRKLCLGQVTYCTRLKKFFVAGNCQSKTVQGEAATAGLVGSAIWASDDGMAWSVVLEDPPSLNRAPPAGTGSGNGDADQNFILGVGSDQKRGLMAFGYKRWDNGFTLHNYVRAWYSADGVSWTLRNGGYPSIGADGIASSGGDVASIAGNGRGAWCCTNNGLYFPWPGTPLGVMAPWQTLDNGQTWQQPSGFSALFPHGGLGCASFVASRGRIFGSTWAFGTYAFAGVAGRVVWSSNGVTWKTPANNGQFLDRPKALAVY